MGVQRKVKNVDGHFTPLGSSKGRGMRNGDNGCCILDGALCSMWKHDHPSCVLMYFAGSAGGGGGGVGGEEVAFSMSLTGLSFGYVEKAGHRPLLLVLFLGACVTFFLVP